MHSKHSHFSGHPRSRGAPATLYLYIAKLSSYVFLLLTPIKRRKYVFPQSESEDVLDCQNVIKVTLDFKVFCFTRGRHITDI